MSRKSSGWLHKLGAVGLEKGLEIRGATMGTNKLNLLAGITYFTTVILGILIPQ